MEQRTGLASPQRDEWKDVKRVARLSGLVRHEFLSKFVRKDKVFSTGRKMPAPEAVTGGNCVFADAGCAGANANCVNADANPVSANRVCAHSIPNRVRASLNYEHANINCVPARNNGHNAKTARVNTPEGSVNALPRCADARAACVNISHDCQRAVTACVCAPVNVSAQLSTALTQRGKASA